MHNIKYNMQEEEIKELYITIMYFLVHRTYRNSAKLQIESHLFQAWIQRK